MGWQAAMAIPEMSFDNLGVFAPLLAQTRCAPATGRIGPMTVTAWVSWVVFETVVAIVVFGKVAHWFGRRARITPSGLESWTGLHLLAFFVAAGLAHWLGTGALAALIAFGLASSMIVGAAVSAAYEAGFRVGGQSANGSPTGAAER
jgi:hypothetical protein